MAPRPVDVMRAVSVMKRYVNAGPVPVARLEEPLRSLVVRLVKEFAGAAAEPIEVSGDGRDLVVRFRAGGHTLSLTMLELALSTMQART